MDLKKIVISALLSSALFAQGESSTLSVSSLDGFSEINSEVFTQEDIRESQASSFAEFLQKRSSINIYPSYGNSFAPRLDSRGFGSANGYQNIAVVVDGVRLRSIDLSPLNLAALPLESISTIKVERGSGSTGVGGGSSGAVIEVTTKKGDYISGDVSYGSYNSKRGSISAQHNIGKFLVGGGGEFYFSDGSREVDSSGNKDGSELKRALAKVGYIGDSFMLEGKVSQYNDYQKYANALTKSQFDGDPKGMGRLSGGLAYSDQSVAIREYGARAIYYPKSELRGELAFNQEEKTSRYLNPWAMDYKYINTTLTPKVEFWIDGLEGEAGAEFFGGSREGALDKTSQNMQGYFTRAIYNIDRFKLRGGVRYDGVNYDYVPDRGDSLDDSKSAVSYEAGVDYKVTANITAFIGLEDSTTMPDIDRFFNYGVFNDFIKPQKMRTYEVGGVYDDERATLKATLFYIDGKDEIYYYDSGSFLTSYNTNLDKTQKKGLELDAEYRFKAVTLRGIYSYIDAMILDENEGGGAYDDKRMPGVYKHNLKLGVDAKIISNLLVGTNFTYNADSYSASDFTNNQAQKQKNYSSLDLALKYEVAKNYELYAEAQNILGYKNGYWVSDDIIYPYNFEPSFKIGGKVNY